MTAALAAIGFDPTRDKSYQRAALARDVVDWLAWLELGGTRPRTLDQYERDLARLCLLWPDKLVGEITDGDLLALAKRFPAGGRRVRMAAVASFFKWAKQMRRIPDNPMEYVPRIRPPKPKVHDVFTPAERESLLSLPVVDAAPLAVLIDAGLRKAEARCLPMRDVNPETELVVVRNGKGGRDRVVPMSDRLRALIADLQLIYDLRPSEYLFYSVRANEVSRKIMRDKPVQEGTFARWWRRCLDDAAVRYRPPHNARHTFATYWRRQGLDLRDVQLLLGHANIATTTVYDHTDIADVARRMALLKSPEQTT
jgi:integrase